MIRAIFIFLIFCFSALQVISQDLLSIQGEPALKVQITEIGTEYIRYKLWGQEEPLYRINREKVSEIKFDYTRDILFQDSHPPFADKSYIQKHHNNRGYLVNGEYVGSFWELGKYMNKNPEAAPLFEKANLYKNRSKKLGYTTIATFGVGVLLAVSDGDYGTVFTIGVISAVFATPLIGTTAIGIKLASLSKKALAEDAYGIRYAYDYPSLPDSYIVNVGFTSNGVGLVVSF